MRRDAHIATTAAGSDSCACDKCDATGVLGVVRCPWCNGTGRVGGDR